MTACMPDCAVGIGCPPIVNARDRRLAAGRFTPLRVFLVEDSVLLHEMVIGAVTDPGRIEIAGCADSERRSIDGVNRSLPDVVIVDICLREGSGLNVLRSISQMIWIRLPVMIVLTSHPCPECAKACRRLGADYFFDKTTEFEDVSHLLETLAEKKRVATNEMQDNF